MKTAHALFVLLALSPFCRAQTATQPASQTAPKEPFVVEAGELTLSALVDRSAAYLGCNILLNPQEMAAGPAPVTVRLQHAVKVDRDGCEDFLTTILYRSGFALVQLDDVGQMREIVSMGGARAREVTARAVARTVEQVLARPNLKVPITTVFELKHINATIATNALRPFFASVGAANGSQLTLGNVGNNSAMLVSGMQDQVAQAIRLLQRCDTPMPQAQLLQAESLLEKLAELERRLQALEQKQAPQQAK
ncbi:MAG: hypothetical protein MUC36_23815 [Planctomycetes bacterium]|nr:hypothetical protein [Planctomycetota bacterium]